MGRLAAHEDSLIRSRPLRRSKPLSRGAHLKKKGSGKYARRERNWGRMAFVHSLPCVVGEYQGITGSCDGPIHAHHMTPRRQDWHDETVVPMCSHHHDCWHGFMGFFKGWTETERDLFNGMSVGKTQGAWDQLTEDERQRWSTRANNMEAD